MTDQVIDVIDVQVAGETGRVLFDTRGIVQGDNMAARLQYCRTHLTQLRHSVLREPRGHANLMGALVVPPTNPASDFGLIVMEQADYSAMSGANLMCAVTAIVDTEYIPIIEPITTMQVDTASGTVHVTAQVEKGRTTDITIDSVPSFAVLLDHVIDVPEFGEIAVDVGFGGQFYVAAQADAFGLELSLSQAPHLARAANMLLAAARQQISVVHPTEPHLTEISLPILYGLPEEPNIDGKGVVVMPMKQPIVTDPTSWEAATIDRCPGGTGTCARMAIEYAKGRLQIGEEFVQQSLLGTTFTGKFSKRMILAGQEMLEPVLTGRGWVVSRSQLQIATDDPFPEGFVF